LRDLFFGIVFHKPRRPSSGSRLAKSMGYDDVRGFDKSPLEIVVGLLADAL
jgi:hypothetical protein